MHNYLKKKFNGFLKEMFKVFIFGLTFINFLFLVCFFVYFQSQINNIEKDLEWLNPVEKEKND